MSQEVALNAKDYINIMRWFELAFGRRSSVPQADRDTFSKTTVMALAYTEEQKTVKEEDNDK